MTKIQILGSGCDKCGKLAANAKLAAERLHLSCEIEKVEDINQIIGFGVMITPALVVDGKVVSSGKVLTPDEITGFLAAPACDCSCQCISSETKTTESPCGCGDHDSEKESAAPCRCSGRSDKKKIMTIVLFIFVVASIVFMVIKQMKGASSAAAAAGTEQKNASAVARMDDVLTVYCFHGNRRCMTCSKIEQLTKQALEEKYAGALASGKIVFRAVNVEEPVNEHFVRDFGLTVRGVVMAGNGRFEKFDSVWNLVRDPEKFQSCIQEGVKRMMGKTLDE